MLAAILLGATAGRGDPERHGRRHPGDPERRHSASNQLHAAPENIEADRIGIGTMASRRLRSAGHGELFRRAGSQFARAPSRVKAVEFLIDHPLVGGSCRRGAQSRGTDRPHSSYGFVGLHVDARAPAIARRQSAGRARVLRQSGEERRRISTSRSATARRSPTSTRAIPPRPSRILQELLQRVSEGNAILRRAGAGVSGERPDQGIAGGAGPSAELYFRATCPITIRLAETLMHAGDNKRAQLILDDLFNQVEPTPNQSPTHRQGRQCRGRTSPIRTTTWRTII